MSAHSTTHDRYRELVAGHALAALEPEDEQALRAHLSACASCQREVDELRAAATQLAYAAPPIDPPASVFEGIRQEILADSPEAFTLSRLEAAQAQEAPVATGQAEPDDVVVPLHRRLRLDSRASRLVAAAAAVAIAAVVGLASWNISLRGDDGPGLSPQAVDVLELPGPRAQLNDTGGLQHASAVVHGGEVHLVNYGLTIDADSERFVLWAAEDNEVPRAVADFALVPDSDVVLGITPTGELGSRLLLSKEPGAVGQPLPTVPSVPVASGSLA